MKYQCKEAGMQMYIDIIGLQIYRITCKNTFLFIPEEWCSQYPFFGTSFSIKKMNHSLEALRLQP